MFLVGLPTFKVCCRVDDIESMKNLALLIMFGVSSVALSAEEYTIQTISAKKEVSITPAFEKKVQKSALPMSKKKEGECNIVTVGKYPTAKAASADIKKAKEISKDAFVRTVERTTPKVCESKSAAAATAMKDTNATVTPKSESVALKESPAPAQSVTTAVAPKETPAVSATPLVVKTVEPVVSSVEKPEIPKAEPCKVQPCETNVYVYDKNLARKSDIHEAIEYYKHSPYHSFRPVALQGGK